MNNNKVETIEINKLKIKLNNEQLYELKKFLNRFKIGEIFNPYNLNSEIFNRDKKEEILNELIKQGKIKKLYYVVCPGCLDYSREYYTNLEDIKKNYMCRKCEYEFTEEIDIEKHLQIRYLIIEYI